MGEGYVVLSVVNTQFREGIGRASGRRSVSRSAGRGRLLNIFGTKKLVEAAGLRRVVRNALSSPNGGVREGNRLGWLGQLEVAGKG